VVHASDDSCHAFRDAWTDFSTNLTIPVLRTHCQQIIRSMPCCPLQLRCFIRVPAFRHERLSFCLCKQQSLWAYMTWKTHEKTSNPLSKNGLVSHALKVHPPSGECKKSDWDYILLVTRNFPDCVYMVSVVFLVFAFPGDTFPSALLVACYC
jgi:hypothetical protein